MRMMPKRVFIQFTKWITRLVLHAIGYQSLITKSYCFPLIFRFCSLLLSLLVARHFMYYISVSCICFLFHLPGIASQDFPILYCFFVCPFRNHDQVSFKNVEDNRKQRRRRRRKNNEYFKSIDFCVNWPLYVSFIRRINIKIKS